MLNNTLNKILEELQLYKKDKSTCLKYYIANRLNESFLCYSDELNLLETTIDYTNDYQIVTRLNKL